ncbi:hypothetical protein D9C73_009305 [Collichthys lucidus]|uniref:Uncharacterized protein n=1 Tax=Collichthys lucidus TaxID=240159 RepID=A0A4U5ULQ2_COLLU|nr:hypothetical protein D9C73_009305 [Collichthys lucidus]
MGLASHRLIQPCKTRWNSVCEMFDQLEEQQWAVVAVLSDRTVTRLQDARILELKEEYWQLMEDTQDTQPVLSALKCATTVMSAEKDVTISNTYCIPSPSASSISILCAQKKTGPESLSSRQKCGPPSSSE